MKNVARQNGKSKSGTERRIFTTAGEMFADGSAIELVATGPTDDNKPTLLFWNGNKSVTAPQIEHGGRIYEPVEIHESILQAIAFPHRTALYGTPRRLLGAVAQLLEQYIGLSEPDAARVTAWIATTWFPDCLSSPPVLSVSAVDMHHAIPFFRLLSSVCRRPLMLTDITPAALKSLPMCLRPTLLLNQPELSPRARSLFRASNYRGVVVPTKAGQVIDVACPKAIFTESPEPGAIHVALLPDRKLALLGDHEQIRIARQFQPRFLLYRLHHLRKVRRSQFAASKLSFPTNELAHHLVACIQDSPELALRLPSLLQPEEEDARIQRACDPTPVIIEVLWPMLHPLRARGENRIEELAKNVNTVLRCRGEIREYSPEEIGKRLKRLGFERQRRNSGMVLVLARETSRRVHQLACSFALGAKVAKCPDCEEMEISLTSLSTADRGVQG